jgi:phosphatidylserine/phosphatidylglycerophosphate/cardiolipin synthase-like enzyme
MDVYLHEKACVGIWFSPHGGCEQQIVDQIRKARKEIRVATFQLSRGRIADELVVACKRGVTVAVVVDKQLPAARYSPCDMLYHAGCKVYVDRGHLIMHHKYIVLDKSVVITGSHNFTKNSENSNAENLIVLRNDAIANQFLENWSSLTIGAEEFRPTLW